MADTVLESIAKNVLATAQSVTTGNGFNYTLNASRATKLNEPAHLKATIFQLTPERVDDSGQAFEEWLQPFAIVVDVLPTETDTTPVDTYNNLIAGDLHKAFMTDFTRGGLAVNTEIEPTLYFPPVKGEVAGITFGFKVRYRHKLYDPYNTP